MKSRGELLFLGTGGSMGIPVIGCDCPVCRSTSPRNQRLRPSTLLTIANKKIVIDAGPDFRQQALKYGINHLDGVIYTHAHHDHTAGIDDLRAYHLRVGEVIECLLSQATATDLRARYHYIFAEQKSRGQLTTRIVLRVLEDARGAVVFLGIPVRHFTFQQAQMPVNGYRIGNLALVSDISRYPDTIFQDLEGVDTLILSALRYKPSPLHFHIDQAIAFAQKVGAAKTWLTHVAHEVDHEKANACLPPNIELAYDGLSINFEVDII